MKKALPLVLLGVAALLVCLGVAALSANFFVGQNNTVDLNQWKTPLDLVDSKKVPLATALEPLAGIGDSVAIDDALQQGDWEAAFTTLAFSPDLNDASRAGTLLLLGSRYVAGKQTAKAAWCYQYAATLATLSPVLSDLVRTQTLIQAAQGLADLNASAARSSLDQAYLIAQYSPTMPNDTRSRLYAQIGQAYTKIKATNLAAQAQQKSEEASMLAADDMTGTPWLPYRLQGAAPKPTDELAAKTDARITAAKELMDQLSLHPPKTEKDLPDRQVQSLGDKLFQEDGARTDYYDTMSNSAVEPKAQAALLRDKIGWLALKLRVARRGFGLSLVPEWEADAQNIMQELNDMQDQLYMLSEQQAITPEKTADADRQLEDVLRTELVAGRWGLYQYDENDLRSRLDEIERKLSEDQVAALRLDSFMIAKKAVYLLVPDELYGQGEKALPK